MGDGANEADVLQEVVSVRRGCWEDIAAEEAGEALAEQRADVVRVAIVEEQGDHRGQIAVGRGLAVDLLNDGGGRQLGVRSGDGGAQGVGHLPLEVVREEVATQPRAAALVAQDVAQRGGRHNLGHPRGEPDARRDGPRAEDAGHAPPLPFGPEGAGGTLQVAADADGLGRQTEVAAEHLAQQGGGRRGAATAVEADAVRPAVNRRQRAAQLLGVGTERGVDWLGAQPPGAVGAVGVDHGPLGGGGASVGH